MENNIGVFNVINFIKEALKVGASDEHIVAGEVPYIRVNGVIEKFSNRILSNDDIDAAFALLAPEHMKGKRVNEKEFDFTIEIPNLIILRVCYYLTNERPAMAIRNIPIEIPRLEELKLPSYLQNILSLQNGIILVTGPTGSGKSSTIASLLNEINLTQKKHIITVEDPGEYVFKPNKCIISQRIVGYDTKNYYTGLRTALRQDPDIIFIGEIRDKETMYAALNAAETGHLVFATLHTSDSIKTISRVVNMFEETSRDAIREQLADVLRVTIAQKLLYSNKYNSRFPAVEVLVNTPAIKDYIVKNELDRIYDILKDNFTDNMCTLNDSLADLVENEIITKEIALANSNDANELEQMLRGVSHGSKFSFE